MSDPTPTDVAHDNMRPNADPTARPDEPTPDQTGDQTGDRDELPIPEAAERLGLTTDAVRMRLKRGTLHGRKREGRWVVFVPRSVTEPTATEHPGSTASAATEQPTERDQTQANAMRELVDTLRDENQFLRDELAARTEEIRRRDHIIAGFIERLPELPAGSERTAAATAHEASTGETSTATPDPVVAAVRRWWRQITGGRS